MSNIIAEMKGRLSPARDQGRRPTCLAFAASLGHRLAHSHSSELSIEWLYYHATIHDGLKPEEGSTIDATRAVISGCGQPDDAFWPYIVRNFNSKLYHPPSGNPTVVRCDSGLRRNASDSWRADIAAGIPVIIALFISASFYNPHIKSDKEAFITDDELPIESALVHAVGLIGYGSFDGRPHFLIRNSWGSRWGQAGNAWSPETYLTRRFAGAFVIQHGASDDVQSNDPGSHTRLRVG